MHFASTEDISIETPTSLLNLFQQTGTTLHYYPGDVILRADDTPSGVYLIKKGAVKTYYFNPRGEINIHTIYKKNEMFPVAWAIKGITFPSNFAAIDSVVLLRLPLMDFRKAIATDVVLSNEMTERVADQLISYVYRIGNLQYSNAHERVIFQLILLCHRFGKQTDQGCVIDLPITHGMLASMINVARETASRSLQRLVKKGIVQQSGKQLIILDVDLLYSQLKQRNVIAQMLQH